MPYSTEHKAKTRERIVESARMLFNRHGFDRVSIDDIMEAAGLTRGGFYYHFKSKQALYAEAVRSYSSRNPFSREVARTGQREPRELARLFVELYLSDDVLDDTDQHCPLVALPSDIARAGREPRDAYTQVINNMLKIFTAAFKDQVDDKRNALVLVNLCVGGMVLARTTEDAWLRKSLRAAARQQALALLEGTGAT